MLNADSNPRGRKRASELLKRLRRTTVDEIGARALAALTRRTGEARHALGLPAPAEPAVPEREPALWFRAPWFDREEMLAIADQIRARHRDHVGRLVAHAEALAARRFRFFGGSVEFAGDITWTADPVSGRPWPMTYYTRVPLSGEGAAGDVKYVWELNRHQFLPVLAKAYLLTGRERYATAAVQMVDSWIDANPYQTGVNWTSALEVGVRAISWCWTFSMLRSADQVAPLRSKIIDSLGQHAAYLAEHPSFYVSPYNHVVGEAAALFILGAAMPFARDALLWRERGWSILTAEIDRQFHPDGGSVEQATGYHHFTLGFYLQAVLARQRLENIVSPGVWSRLERAVDFAANLTRPDGTTPMIGDVDEGRPFDLMQPDPWDYRSYLAIGAVVFERRDLKQIAGAFPPDAAWLVGLSGWNYYDRLKPGSPEALSTAMPASGYYIMRTGWGSGAHMAILDCGEIAAGVPADAVSSAAHGHADALSVELAAYGTPLVIDPGSYTYNGAADWHRYFRETAAHNTVVVDGESQAEFAGRLRWAHAPKVTGEKWLTTELLDYVAGSHDGYTRLPQPVIHRRSLLFLKADYWIIRDELTGEGEHTLDRFFHFPPGELERLRRQAAVHARTERGAGATFRAFEPDAEFEIVAGGDGPEGGWIAPGYERRLSAPVLRIRVRARLPVALFTVIAPFRWVPHDLAIRALPIEATDVGPLDTAFEIAMKRRRDAWLFSASPRPVRFGAWSADARVAWVSVNSSGRAHACALVDGRGLEGKSRALAPASATRRSGAWPIAAPKKS